jgi:hypothetical protein
MMIMTLWALVTLLKGWLIRLQAGGPLLDPTAVAALLLLALAASLIREGWRQW